MCGNMPHSHPSASAHGGQIMDFPPFYMDHVAGGRLIIGIIASGSLPHPHLDGMVGLQAQAP